MCGRTGQAIPPEVLETRWDARVPDAYEPRYNVAPREPLAVIHSEDPNRVAMPEWGLLPQWVDDPAEWHYPINARSETVTENGTFREAFKERPCLVLSSGYYEWQGERGAKRPYRICREDREPFALAGVWERWQRAGTTRTTVTILTCEANGVVEPIHDRMPVTLSPAAESRWLASDHDTRRELLRPIEGAAFEAYPLTRTVNDPSYDRPDVIDPLDTKQSDLGTFGA